MSFTNRLFLTVFAAAAACSAADPQPPTLSKVFDNQLRLAEREVVSLAEAMPADKYAFAPSDGEFKGVRTFELQVKHLATTLYVVGAGSLGEKSPVEAGENENGAASIKGKEATVKYLKDAFAYAHKATQALTPENATQMMDNGAGGKSSRIGMANVAIWHSFDHYGQMVVYARMNGIVPPASQPQPSK